MVSWTQPSGKLCLSQCFFSSSLCPTGHTDTPKLNLCSKCWQKCSIKSYQMFGAKLSLAELSGRKIVRFYYVGAKLSGCQIVCFQLLVPNCPLPIVWVPNCPLLTLDAKFSSAKLSGCKIVAMIAMEAWSLYFTIIIKCSYHENIKCQNTNHFIKRAIFNDVLTLTSMMLC